MWISLASTARLRAYVAIGATLLLVAGIPAAVLARQPARALEELEGRIKLGEIVYVIDSSGLQTRGTVDRLSGGSIGLLVDGSRRDFMEGEVARIERRRRDPVRDGLLIGMGSGALIGFFAGRAVDSPTCPRPGAECGQGATLGTVTGALWGAVGGWAVDRLHNRREVIYLTTPAEPSRRTGRVHDGQVVSRCTSNNEEPTTAIGSVSRTTGVKCQIR